VPLFEATGSDERSDRDRGHDAVRARRLHDDELVRRVRDRDEAALTSLYDRYGGLILTVALRIVGDREVAEEVMQDTFLRLWNASGTYQPSRGNVSGWLIGIARNRAIDVLRSRLHKSRQREGTPLPGSGNEDTFGVPDEAEAIATRQAVQAALIGLSRQHRQVVELAYYGGLSQAEIARELGEPLGTVKSRSRVAMEQLRGALRPHFRPDERGDGER
jgi:RNA polymerase sigma-70 factor (ECF subfamily)